MAGDICDVCDRSDVIGVFASPFGPISFAYCDECALADASPRWLVVWKILDAGGVEHLREDLRQATHCYMDGVYVPMDEVAAGITDEDRAKYEKDMNAMAGPRPVET